MSEHAYFQVSPYVRSRMPKEVAEVMSTIADTVVEKLGELSLLSEISNELPPVQSALLKSAVESPGFKLKAARAKHEVLAPLQGNQVTDEIIKLEEALYERGVIAEWHIDRYARRPKNELVVYYIKSTTDA